MQRRLLVAVILLILLTLVLMWNAGVSDWFGIQIRANAEGRIIEVRPVDNRFDVLVDGVLHMVDERHLKFVLLVDSDTVIRDERGNKLQIADLAVGQRVLVWIDPRSFIYTEDPPLVGGVRKIRILPDVREEDAKSTREDGVSDAPGPESPGGGGMPDSLQELSFGPEVFEELKKDADVLRVYGAVPALSAATEKRNWLDTLWEVVERSNAEIEGMSLLYPEGPLVSWGVSDQGYAVVYFLKGSTVEKTVLQEIYAIFEQRGRELNIENVPVVFGFEELPNTM